MKNSIFSLIILIVLQSCGKDDKKLLITDFTQSKIITVKPYKNYPYAMMNVWVKGNVNDTILIKLKSKDSKPIMTLTGEIDERWYTDYYGEGERTIFFEPYKATQGNLEIRVKL